MKTLKIILLALACNFSSVIYSQVSVNINVGSPPLWGPVGYNDVRYYYLPDVEAYYDVQTSMFIYYGGGVWIHRAHLPSHYSNYDLYGGYKVVMFDYRGETPYIHFKNHKIKYKKGYKGPAQKTIGQGNGKGNQKKSSNHQPAQAYQKGGGQKSSDQRSEQKHDKGGSKHQQNSESGNQQKQSQGQKGGGNSHGGGGGKGKK